MPQSRGLPPAWTRTPLSRPSRHRFGPVQASTVPVSPSPVSREASRDFVALDQPFDGRVQTANVGVSISTLSANTLDDIVYMFRAKRPLYLRYMSYTLTAETNVCDERGRKPKRFTQADGEGGQSDESWPLAWRWSRWEGGRMEGGLTTRRCIRAIEFQPDSETIQVWSKIYTRYDI